jgi:hypothetical protein
MNVSVTALKHTKGQDLIPQNLKRTNMAAGYLLSMVQQAVLSNIITDYLSKK